MKLIVFVVCLGLLSAALLARDLHSVARKERARRDAIRSTERSSRPLTNEDLEAYSKPGASSKPARERTLSLSPRRDLAKEESFWRGEKLRHDRELARLDASIRKLEWRLRDHRLKRRLKGGLRDDPTTALIEESLESLREERRKIELQFRERARKAGAFPGWLR